MCMPLLASISGASGNRELISARFGIKAAKKEEDQLEVIDELVEDDEDSLELCNADGNLSTI